MSQTLVFLSLTTAVSLRVTDLGKVFQLVGSTAGMLVMCIIPGILLLQPAPTSHASRAAGAVRGGARSSHGGSQRRAGRGRSGAHGGAGGGRGVDDVDDDADGRADDEDVVGEAAPSRGSGGTRGRRQRHWTEGGSFGGYDELNVTATGVADQSGAATEARVGGGGAPSFRDTTHEDMRATLLPAGYRHEEEEDEEMEEGDVEVAVMAGGGGGVGGIVAQPGKRRRGCGGNDVSVTDALRGYGLLMLGVFIAVSNIYVIFFSPSAGNEKRG